MRLMLFTALFVLLLGSSYAQEYNYRFQRYGLQDGLPSLVVNAMLEDDHGFIWAGTDDGLARLDPYAVKSYVLPSTKSGPGGRNQVNTLAITNNEKLWLGASRGLFVFDLASEQMAQVFDSLFVGSVIPDRDQGLWLGTQRGLYRYEFSTLTMEHIPLVERKSAVSIFDLHVDSQERLWISTLGAGLFLYEGDKITNFSKNPSDQNSISSNTLREVVELPNGDIAVGTENNGLDILDPSTSTFRNFTYEESNPKSLSTQSAYALMVDANDNFWVGTWGHALNLFNYKNGEAIRFIHNPDNARSIPSNFVKALFQSSTGDIWLGTEGGGLGRFHEEDQQIIRFTHDSQNSNSLSTNSVRSVYEDSTGVLWIGTSQYGLNRYDPKTNKFKTYLRPNGSRESLARGFIWSISPGDDNVLWLGTGRGIAKFNTENETISFIGPSDDGLLSNNVLRVLDDRKGSLWVGSWYGGLNRMDISSGSFDRYSHDPEDPTSLGSSDVVDVFIDSKDRVWVGTSSSLSLFISADEGFKNYDLPALMISEDGLGQLWVTTAQGLVVLNPETDSTYFFSEKDDLTTHLPGSILIGEDGLVWLSSNKGVDVYDPVNQKLVEHLDLADGLVGLANISRACYLGPSGSYYFGGAEGLSQINPERLINERNTPNIQFTDLLLFNRKVNPSDSTVLKQSVHRQAKVILNYTDYIFALDFAALDFSRPEEVIYEYQLEGFDDHWIPSNTDNRRAVFTNVPPGSYSLKVRGSAAHAMDFTENSIFITIIPPWWETWWAQLILYMAIVVAIFSFTRLRLDRVKKQKVALEAEVKKRTREIAKQKEEIETQATELRELNDQKDKLFSIVSHDLRNPLATLKGTLNLLDPSILREEDLDNIRSDIEERVDGLSAVILNLLDWSKSQLEGETINPEPIPLKALGDRKVNLFAPSANSKNISLINNFPDDIELHADVNQVRTIFRNALGNAIKFTESGGRIELNAEVSNEEVIISIKDTGLGMSQEKIDSLFSLQSNTSTLGTSGEKGVGLGTLLIKEFAEKNGGRVWIESEENVGTNLFFSLPICKHSR